MSAYEEKAIERIRNVFRESDEAGRKVDPWLIGFGIIVAILIAASHFGFI